MASGYKITVDLPNTAKGQEVQIPGLGTFQNGVPAEVTAEMADAFRVFQADIGGEDRTLLQAFSKDEHVTVETADVEKPKKVTAGPGQPVPSQSAVVQSTDTSDVHTTDTPPKEGDK